MKITIDSKELGRIIYLLFVGDCECRTECYKHCYDLDEKGRTIDCPDAIEKTLLEYLEQKKVRKQNKWRNIMLVAE